MEFIWNPMKIHWILLISNEFLSIEFLWNSKILYKTSYEILWYSMEFKRIHENSMKPHRFFMKINGIYWKSIEIWWNHMKFHNFIDFHNTLPCCHIVCNPALRPAPPRNVNLGTTTPPPHKVHLGTPPPSLV